jgi:hypothetical protein
MKLVTYHIVIDFVTQVQQAGKDGHDGKGNCANSPHDAPLLSPFLLFFAIPSAAVS